MKTVLKEISNDIYLLTYKRAQNSLGMENLEKMHIAANMLGSSVYRATSRLRDYLKDVCTELTFSSF